MNIPVEPQTGRDLDRFVTALLNATGIVYHVIEAAGSRTDDGAGVIGRAGSRLRDMLALMAEHNSDEELALATQMLAETTLLVAAELDLGHLFGVE